MTTGVRFCFEPIFPQNLANKKSMTESRLEREKSNYNSSLKRSEDSFWINKQQRHRPRRREKGKATSSHTSAAEHLLNPPPSLENGNRPFLQQQQHHLRDFRLLSFFSPKIEIWNRLRLSFFHKVGQQRQRRQQRSFCLANQKKIFEHDLNTCFRDKEFLSSEEENLEEDSAATTELENRMADNKRTIV